MKNVNGLAKAMTLVESACEKGEITIIGEGAKPSAVELYKKCVVFINKEYGVDILNLVLNENKPCECNGSCTTVIVEHDVNEDVEEYLDIDLTLVSKIIQETIENKMNYLSKEIVDEISYGMCRYYMNIDETLAEDYDEEEVSEALYEVLDNNLNLEDYNEDYVNDIIEQIIDKIDNHKCIKVVSE